MTCDGVRPLLSAYLDGELAPGELLGVEQHLRRCHSCADEVDSLRQTVSLIAGLPEVELPADFHANLHHRLVALGPPALVRPAASASAWQRHLRDWALPAAAAAAVLAVSLASFQQVGNHLPGIEVPHVAIIEPRQVVETFSDSGPVSVEPVKPDDAETPTVTQPGTPLNHSDDPPKVPPVVVTPKPDLAVVTPAPPGPVVVPALSAHTVSYVKDLPVVQSGAKQLVYSYSFSASVANPDVTIQVLKAKYNRLEVPSPTEVIIRVPAATAARDRDIIKQILGETVIENVPVSTDVASTNQTLYAQLSVLDMRRAQMVKTAAEASGSVDLDAAVAALDQVKAEADQARAEYDQALKRAGEATIVIVFDTKQAQ